MKEEKDIQPIDDLFRQSLGGYMPPPPPGAWKNIRQQLGKGRNSRWRFLFALPGLIFLSSIILTVSGLIIYNVWFSTSNAPAPSKTSVSTIISLQTEKHIVTGTSSSQQVHSIDSVNSKKHQTHFNTNNKTGRAILETVGKGPRPKDKIKTVIQPGLSQKTGQKEQKNTTEIVGNTTTLAGKAVAGKDSNLMITDKNEAITAPVKVITDNPFKATDIEIEKNKGDEFVAEPAVEPSKSIPSIPVPEDLNKQETNIKDSIVNTIAPPTEANKQSRSDKSMLGLTASVTCGIGQVILQGYSPLSFYSYYATTGVNHKSWGTGIETGLGFSRYQDHGNFEFEFLKSDTTGYQGFTYFNPLDSSYLFIFKPIIDQKQIFYSTTTKTSYSYLSIPLYFNQQLLKRGKFAFGVKAGPSVNLLIKRNEVQPIYDIPGTSFIKLSDSSYTRLSTNWQFLVATRFSWQLADHFALLLEPTVLFYLNNLYENNSRPNSTPYGVGIWAGIQYKFKK
jgi:hypothetical protein